MERTPLEGYKLTHLPIEEPRPTLSMHPHKFLMWLFIVTIVMLFAALTSAYIVRRAEGNWLEFDLPDLLWVSSGVILVSSITMHWAYVSARRDSIGAMKVATLLTSLLGVAFMVTQWQAWSQLVDQQVFFAGSGSNPSGSFMYVLTGLHALHIVAGLIFLFIVLGKAFRQQIHAKSMTVMEMGATFWHFLGGLWIYLFMFLLLNQS